MTSFNILLQDTTHSQTYEGVTSFVGEDNSGSFGVMANHSRMMATLVMGLARFRINEQPWQYVATPGALIYFFNNQLTLSTRHFFIDEDYMRISLALEEQLLKEENQLRNQKQSLRHMEEVVLKHLWDIGRSVS